MSRKLGTNDSDYPQIMERKQVADMIGVSPDNFDLMFSAVNYPDFPRLYVKSDLRFPRDAVIVWIKENWERLPQKKWRLRP